MSKKVSELEGAELDYYVAKADGWNPQIIGKMWGGPWAYSTEWRHGGPIIERERIAVVAYKDKWCAYVNDQSAYSQESGYIDVSEYEGMSGQTPLIAAMRCFVNSKFGAEVEKLEF